MENNKINIAEILKDCPKGTKLYSPIFGNVSFEKLIDNVVYPIHVVGQNSRQIYFSEYGLYIADDSCSDAECQLFPSREVRDWNKFFKSGDVLVHWNHGLGVIFKEWIDAYISFKVSICQLKSGGFAKRDEDVFMSEDFSKASDEQRDKFIADMEKYFGGKYNPETLQVEPVKPKCPFEPFDKVLVRDHEEQAWYANCFSHYRGNDKNFPYACLGNNFRYCIPYEGNEHLLGTTDPYTKGGME